MLHPSAAAWRALVMRYLAPFSSCDCRELVTVAVYHLQRPVQKTRILVCGASAADVPCSASFAAASSKGEAGRATIIRYNARHNAATVAFTDAVTARGIPYADVELDLRMCVAALIWPTWPVLHMLRTRSHPPNRDTSD